LLIVVSLIGMAEGCAHSSSGCTNLTAPTAPAYMISGVVTEYRGRPVGEAAVNAYPSEGCNGTQSTQTDQQGHFSWPSPSASLVGLDVWKDGYTPAWKMIGASHSTTNVILHRHLTVNAAGDTVTGALFGDEFLDGDDVLFGGLCSRSPCKVVVTSGEFSLGFPDLEVRLRSTDPTRQLALYVSTVEVVDFDPPQVVEQYRLCCAAELMTTLRNRREYSPPEYVTFLAAASEQAVGPNDSQPFELSVQPIH
jgi:hypothetical protein